MPYSEEGLPEGASKWPPVYSMGIARLSPAAAAEAEILARSSWNRYGASQGPYGVNRLDRHLTGAFGEAGVVEWARLRFGHVVQSSRFSRNKGDVLIDGCRVEVKSFRVGKGDYAGIRLSAVQLPAIAMNSDALVVCRVPEDPHPTVIEVAGWVPVRVALARGNPELSARGIPQFRVDDRTFQPMDEFLAFVENLAGQTTSPTPSSAHHIGRCLEGHSNWHGHCWTCSASGQGAAKWVLVNNHADTDVFHQGTEVAVRGNHPEARFTSGLSKRLIGDVAVDLRPCGRCYA